MLWRPCHAAGGAGGADLDHVPGVKVELVHPFVRSAGEQDVLLGGIRVQRRTVEHRVVLDRADHLHVRRRLPWEAATDTQVRCAGSAFVFLFSFAGMSRSIQRVPGRMDAGTHHAAVAAAGDVVWQRRSAGVCRWHVGRGYH